MVLTSLRAYNGDVYYILAMFGWGRSVKVDVRSDAILFTIGLKCAKELSVL